MKAILIEMIEVGRSDRCDEFPSSFSDSGRGGNRPPVGKLVRRAVEWLATGEMKAYC